MVAENSELLRGYVLLILTILHMGRDGVDCGGHTSLEDMGW